MTKPTVFNYKEHEEALKEIERLKEENNNLRIRCRIAEEDGVQDCGNQKYFRMSRNQKVEWLRSKGLCSLIPGEPIDWDVVFDLIDDAVEDERIGWILKRQQDSMDAMMYSIIAAKKMRPKENYDSVNHPSHYTDGKIEVIDFIEDKKFPYHLGNAVKYISRAGKKDPNKTAEDLRKAIWYIDRYIQTIEGNGEK